MGDGEASTSTAQNSVGGYEEKLTLLPYEQELILDTFADDVVFILARGLGLERLFLNHLHLYSDPSFTVFVLNTTADDEHFFLEKLKQLTPKCAPKILTADVTGKDRDRIYQTGGIQFVTSRIFMVDLLTNRVPLERTSGILIYRAHEILTSYQESFILRLFREKKKKGFVKAFTDQPSAITGSGLGQLQRLADRLYVRRVRIVPRFESSVKASFEASAPNLIEISVELSAAQRRIRTCLIDIIGICIRELKQCTAGMELGTESEEISAAGALRPTALELELRKKTLLVTERQERILGDLRILRKILEMTENLDPVTVFSYISALRSNKEFMENNSGWVFTQTAAKIFSGVESQCSAKDSNGRLTMIPPPKWKAFESVLEEIKEDFLKTKTANPLDRPPVLVLTSNESTCRQLIDLAKFGPQRLIYTQCQIFAELQKRSSKDPEPVNLPLWTPETIAFYDEQILEKDKADLLKELKEAQKKTARAKAKRKRKSTKIIETEEESKQPKLVNFGIIRYAEKKSAIKRRPPAVTLPVEEITIEETASVLDVAITEEEDGGGDLFGSLPALLFTTLQNRYTLIDCLQSLRPQHLILYHSDIAATRLIEYYKAQNPDQQLKVYVLSYPNSTEEERYLTAIQNEQTALESLIREQGVLYVPTEYDVSRDTVSQIRSLALQSDSRQNNRPNDVPVEELQPVVIVDVREFNSELPTVVYRRGIDLHAVTLEVGDYVLSPTMCVERKALDDLAQSLTSGRVFKQIEQMLRHYPKSLLLVESSEKFRQRRVNGGPFQGELTKRSREVRSLLTMLIRANPKLCILWSLSPSHSAELFEELKLDELNPNVDTATGIRSDDLGLEEERGQKRKLNSVVRRQLQTLPDLTPMDLERAMCSNAFSTVGDIIAADTQTLMEAVSISQKTADSLSLWFHTDFRVVRR